jgi:two-component system, sensor histidine kinase and response regulator
MDTPTASPATTDASAATDPDALARLRRFGGDKLLREMIGLYLDAAPERVAAARAALVTGDVMAAELALHSLKSSSAQLGAARLSRLSDQGEIIARTGALDGIAGIIGEMEGELVRVQAWLAGVRDGGEQ